MYSNIHVGKKGIFCRKKKLKIPEEKRNKSYDGIESNTEKKDEIIIINRKSPNQKLSIIVE